MTNEGRLLSLRCSRLHSIMRCRGSINDIRLRRVYVMSARWDKYELLAIRQLPVDKCLDGTEFVVLPDLKTIVAMNKEYAPMICKDGKSWNEVEWSTPS